MSRGRRRPKVVHSLEDRGSVKLAGYAFRSMQVVERLKVSKCLILRVEVAFLIAYQVFI